MKRLICALLCVVMLTVILSGCSVVDLECINMANKIAQNTQFTSNGHMDARIKQTDIGIDFNGSCDISNLNYPKADINLSVSIDGGEPVAGRIIYNGTGQYISVSLFKAWMNLLSHMSGNEIHTAIADDLLENSLNGTTYIGNEKTYMNTPYPGGSYSNLVGATYDFIKSAYKDLTSNVISRTADGINLILDERKLADLIYNITAYTCDHKDEFYNAFMDYAFTFINNSDAAGEFYIANEEVKLKLEESRESFYELIDSLAAAIYDNSENYFSQFNSFSGSYYTGEIAKSDDNSFISKEALKIVFGGTEYINMTTSSELSPRPFETTAIEGNIVSPRTLSNEIFKSYNKLNPMKSVSYTWLDGTTFLMKIDNKRTYEDLLFLNMIYLAK